MTTGLSVSLLELQVSQFSTRETLWIHWPPKREVYFLSTWPNLVTRKTKQKFFSFFGLLAQGNIKPRVTYAHSNYAGEFLEKLCHLKPEIPQLLQEKTQEWNLTPKIHFAVLQEKPEGGGQREATGEGFLGVTNEHSGNARSPHKAWGRPHRPSLIKLSESHSHCAPISNPVVLSSESQRQGFKETILLPYLPSSTPKHEKQRRLPRTSTISNQIDLQDRGGCTFSKLPLYTKEN